MRFIIETAIDFCGENGVIFELLWFFAGFCALDVMVSFHFYKIRVLQPSKHLLRVCPVRLSLWKLHCAISIAKLESVEEIED